MISEETRKRMSDAQKKRFSSNEEKSRLSEGMRIRWTNPEYRGKTIPLLRGPRGHYNVKTRVMADAVESKPHLSKEEFRSRLKAGWTPEKRKRHSEKLKSITSTPEKRAERSQISKEVANRDGVKEKIRIAAFERWNGGFWYGAVKYPVRPVYCELWTEEFRERVRAFFGYICVECLEPQGDTKLPVHHVKYEKKTCCNDDVSDRLFVTLCKSCHAATTNPHKGNRGYWETHFTDMINNYYGGKCWLTKEEMSAYSRTT